MDPELDDATNQAAADDTVHVTADAGVENTDDQANLPPEGDLDPDADNPGDLTAEELAEIEYEGQKYKVHPALKDAVLRQADYTRKTQEVAEQRKALEARQAEIAQQAEVQQAFLKDYAKVERLGEEYATLETKLGEAEAAIAELGDTDWDTWEQINPTQARLDRARYDAAVAALPRLQVGLRKIDRDRETIKSEIEAKQREQASKARAEYANALEKANAELARDLKDDWSPEGQRKLMEFGQTMGFSAEELSSITDPRAIKVLHAAWKAQRQAQTAAARATLQAQQAAKPVPTVGGSAPAGKDPSRMSTEEWMRWRTQQTQSRKAR